MKASWGIGGAILAVAISISYGVGAAETRCADFAEMLAVEGSIEHLGAAVRQAVRKGASVNLVSIGGAFTGDGSDAVGEYYPALLQQELSSRYAQPRFTIFNQGRIGETAEDVARRLDRDVLPLSPSLVIWELGTREAVMGNDIPAFADMLEAGLSRLHAANIDVILITPQFSRNTTLIIDFDPYIQVIKQLAVAWDATVFDRFGSMQEMAEEGGLLDRHGREGGRETASHLQHCIAQTIADYLQAYISSR